MGENLEMMQQEYTVMVVDDDEDYCFLTKRILRRAGVFKQIITASNGLEALKKLLEINASGEDPPTLIFLDLKMPIMDGFEFLEEVSNLPELDLSKTRIFVMTSSVLPKDRERANIYPIAEFISKPLTKKILEDVLS